MIKADEIKVLNHIMADMEDHPECVQLSPEEMEKILEEYCADPSPGAAFNTSPSPGRNR